MRVGVGVVALGMLALVVIDAGGGDDGPGWCVFRRCTGGYCPGCGLTRAARHLIHGDVAGAWVDHPWMVLAAAQVIVGAVMAGAVRLRSSLRGIDSHRATIAFGCANAGLLVAIWVVRLAAGSIPRFF